jgi:DNA transformation protein
MPVSPTLAALLADVLEPLGRIEVRRMFGGGGLMCDGVMIGIVSDDALYLKADDATRGAFEAEGCEPFVYQRKGRTIALGYWRVPERLLDEPDEMIAWSRTALGAALRRAATRSNGEPGPRAGARGSSGRGEPGTKRGRLRE